MKTCPDREELYNKKRAQKVYYFDIDGTITNETEGWDYKNRTPRADVIRNMHDISEEGGKIILWTARYSVDREVTIKWLKEHYVPYAELVMDKPFWDVYVCDKSFNVEHWLKDGVDE